MAGLPVTIRLLDPPLHEFLPHGDDAIGEVAADMGVSVARLRRRIVALSEFNPMLGQRGARLLVSYPEIVEMQARAIFEAAIEAGRRCTTVVIPEIMVPLVATKAELDLVKDRIAQVARAVEKERGIKSPIRSAPWSSFLAPVSWPARSARAPSSSPSAPTT